MNPQLWTSRPGLLHRLTHLFGWNRGRVESWTARCGKPMVGFRCDGCGALLGIHPTPAGFNKFVVPRRQP